MGLRTDLQTLLETILGEDHVYFQPPSNVRINYPCIIYKLSDLDVKRADNGAYSVQRKYTLTLITKDPDTEAVNNLIHLEKTEFDRHFVSDGLNHFIFTIFF